MASEGALYDQARRQAGDYFDLIDKKLGTTALGVVVDGCLAGLSAVLADRIGREATYALLQRHADAAAAPVIATLPDPFEPRT